MLEEKRCCYLGRFALEFLMAIIIQKDIIYWCLLQG